MDVAKKILEYTVKCPVCGSEMKVEEYLYDMPLVGKVIISSGRCQRCGYKWSDARLAESRGPRKIIYRVEKPGDENALVIRASTASIIIPELGVEIKPGPAALGYITTVEGLIMDIIEKTEFICSEPDAPLDECKKKLDQLRKARDGLIKYTIIIIDPGGVSTIVSDKKREEPLSIEETNALEKEVSGNGFSK
ncbi:ZPR1 zinc finger domain-containing protein [Staphylothermus hellenicus]|uniref:ZPR1-related zinc finger protein n=1 Tax=Staphylothermus hellenicus (strain DSM 12710 / JCM 10830 / BK20S6-10-b1 / P8) TaxID=591019 RepID=D7DBK2_STAHD|nr:ZPR1 zinc finger domain-containing protein [Staphylothermus hellenicus]ADI31549.1 ZPR1-related zinc finger protein [Staphylothermus hellenicus DSM 12710]